MRCHESLGILIVLVMFTMFSPKAFASFWIECKFETTVIESIAIEKNRWKTAFEPGEGVVTDGHTTTGDPCMVEASKNDPFRDNEHVVLETTKKYMPGAQEKLRYNYYDSMGPNGIIQNYTWEIWEFHWGDLLK